MDPERADYADPDSTPPPQWLGLLAASAVSLCLLVAALGVVALAAAMSGPRFD